MKLRFFLSKELKKYPLFFLIFFFTTLLGTLGLIGISLISGRMQEKLQESANELLTSDISVSARREFTAIEQKILFDVFSVYPNDHYHVIDLYSMVSHHRKKSSRLVEIRSTQAGFPFYGEIILRDGEFNNQELYISQDLADQWEIDVGEILKVGDVTMKISGIVVRDSSMGLRGFSLAPRIYFPLEKLSATGLTKPGATGSFAYHFKLKTFDPHNIKDIKSLLLQRIKDSAIKITLPTDASEQTGRVFNIITNFMALSALIGLILSLVGVFYLYQSHLHARLRDLCVLNLYGLSKNTIALGILFQYSIVFFIVIAFELIGIVPLYQALAPTLSENLGFELGKTISFWRILKDLPFLYLLSLLILLPLILGLLRTEMGVQIKAQKISLGRFRFYDFFPFAFLLWIFSNYLARSFRTGSIFFFSIFVVFILSIALVKIGQWSIKKLVNGKGLSLPFIEFGIALRGLMRSGHKLTLSFLSLVMGAALISLILQLDVMILNEFLSDNKKPSLFLFDIQEEQLGPLVFLARENETPLEFITPMIRARLEKVNGQKFIKKKQDYDFRSSEEDEADRFRSHALNLTYRNYLTKAEKIVEGASFPQKGSSDRLPYVSIEKRWASRMDVSIGDRLTFDVQGVEIEGLVRNIKEVKWTSFYPNFFVTVEPGVLDGAPKTFLATILSVPKEKKLSLQRASVDKFPNVSFIDVEELIIKLTNLFTKSRKAIELMSWLSLTIGLIILYGLSHDQVYRRYYDLALLKSLGLSPWRLRINLLCEFGIVFFSAVSFGLFLGWGMAQIIGREVFKLSWSIDWERILYPFLLLMLLCLSTILIASWRAVQSRPRELLSDI